MLAMSRLCCRFLGVIALSMLACSEGRNTLASREGGLSDAPTFDTAEAPGDLADTGAPDGTDLAEVGAADADITDALDDARDGVDEILAPDAGLTDAAIADTSLNDTSIADTAIADTAIADTLVADTSLNDTLVADTSLNDTSVADTSLNDTSVADTSLVDTSVADTSLVDTADTAVLDTALDTAEEVSADTSADTSMDAHADTFLPDVTMDTAVDPDGLPDITDAIEDTRADITPDVPPDVMADVGPDAGPTGCETNADCDDGSDCTVDDCDASGQCQHGPAQCVCEGAPLAVGYSSDFELDGESIPCPMVGGSFGFTTTLAVSGQYTPAHCRNECEANLALSGSLSTTINLCSDSLTIAGTASYSGTSKQCLECDRDTCEKTCTGGTCDSNTFGGQASLTYTRFYGYQVKKKSGPAEVAIKCGASLSGTPSVGVSGTKTDDNGFACPGASCTQCLAAQVQVGFGVQGAVDCFIGMDIWNGTFKKDVGCKSCGTIGVNTYGGVGGQRGACGGKLCAFAGAGISASASSPCVGFSVGWIGFSARCSLTASACAEANNCGSCQCKNCADATVGLSCSVNASGQCN
jgi:hypothetical protein